MNNPSKKLQQRNRIEVAVSRYGVHCWPDAPLPVQYLRYEHCHTFYFCLAIEVDDLDRQYEFDSVQAFLYGAVEHLDLIKTGSTYSCEQMAKLLFDLCVQTYPSLLWVKVGEHQFACAVVERES